MNSDKVFSESQPPSAIASEQQLCAATESKGHHKLPAPVEEAPKPTLMMRVTTWQRDSHGLYDYESTQVEKLSIKTRQPGFIVRKALTPEHSVVTYEENPANAIAQVRTNEQGQYVLARIQPQGDGGPEHHNDSLIWRVVTKRGELTSQIQAASADENNNNSNEQAQEAAATEDLVSIPLI